MNPDIYHIHFHVRPDSDITMCYMKYKVGETEYETQLGLNLAFLYIWHWAR